jgi:cobalt-zinc-cadmium efflux system membrane fusion protein
MRSLVYFLFFFFIFQSSGLQSNALAGPEDHGHDHVEHGHGHDEHGGDHDEHGHGRVHISSSMLEHLGITVAAAGPGTVAETVTTYGHVTTVPGGVSHVRARFPGLITGVRATIGSTVQAGDVLAEVESNESLKRYEIRSPITGVITERHANTGESTGDRVLFTVTNLDRLWIALKVFPSQQGKVAPKQSVIVKTENLSQEASLLHLVPASDGEPFITARAELNNEDGRWAPGLLAKGVIHTGTTNAAVMVDDRALHTLEGEAVVFVVEGDEFVPREVQTGRSDGLNTEILSGLEPGERYAVANSYLIKADIKKSEAEHAH